ncbi:MAG: hypothetical protein KKA97_01230 [Actinobacteria bacterium]|nr:hypothetical protein [Actinomycetota bacterium]
MPIGRALGTATVVASLVAALATTASAGASSSPDGTSRLVAGRVTDAAGAPLAGVEVQLHTRTERFSGPSGDPVLTDAAGHYEIASTIYYVPDELSVSFLASGDAAGLADEAWDDAYSLDEATPLTFDDAGVAAGIDAVLDEPGLLTGRVTDDLGRPVVGAAVRASRLTRGSWSFVGWSSPNATTSEDGRYRLPIAKGVVRLEVDVDDDALRDAFVGGASPDLATEISVTPGASTDLGDTKLQRVGHIRGRLVEDGNRERRPGCLVRSYRQTGDSWVLDGRTSPDAVGKFSLPSIPGRYVLRFCDDADEDYRIYREEWWRDARVPGQSTTIDVRAEEVTGGLRASLERRAIIAGKVRLRPGPVPVRSFPVRLMARRAGAWVTVASTATLTMGANYGRWSFAGVDPGRYKVVYRPPAFLDRGRSRVRVRRGDDVTGVRKVLQRLPLLNVERPTIVGDARVGSTLAVTPGAWETQEHVATNPRVTFQWLADGLPVRGATAGTFTPRTRQLGRRLRVVVATVAEGYTYVAGTAVSDSTSPVER